VKRQIKLLISAALAAVLLLGVMTGALAAARISIGNDRSSCAVLTFAKGALADASAFTLNGIDFRADRDGDSVSVTYGDLATALILKGLKSELKAAGLSLDDLYIVNGCIGIKSPDSEKASALTKVLKAAGIEGQWVSFGDTLVFRIDSDSLYLRRGDVAKARFSLKAFDGEGDKVGSVSIRVKKLFDHGNIPDAADVNPTTSPTADSSVTPN